MQLVLRQLERSNPSLRRYPVIWSEGRKAVLKDTAYGQGSSSDLFQAGVAAAVLRCADGECDAGELDALKLLRDNLDRCNHDPATFNALLQALFVVQRFDVVGAMLQSRHEFAGEIQLCTEDVGRDPACLRWEIGPSGEQRFIFDANIFRDDRTTHKILHLHWIFPLFANYASQSVRETGTVLINQFDLGIAPGLAFCDSRPDYFLLPDQIFVPSRGYAYARKILRESEIPWHDRRQVAFWRGSTTGPKSGPADWRSLDRAKLCQLALRHKQAGLFDTGLTSVVQFASPDVEQEIRKAGLMAAFVPWQAWGQYKYHIDIDGNSSPFSNLFQRLLTGSPVLKVASPRGLRQWFYGEFVPWRNYIPIAPDMSDLVEKVRWLTRHDDFAEKVGRAGQSLAESLTYDREMRRSVPVISAALRYFRGDYSAISPFGAADPDEGGGSCQ